MTQPPSKLGPWQILKELGKGEFSSVYLAKLDSTGELWALKLSPLVESGPPKKKETKPQTCCRLLFWEHQVYSNYAIGHPLFPLRPPPPAAFKVILVL
jgi:serine/threonine protein kinase